MHTTRLNALFLASAAALLCAPPPAHARQIVVPPPRLVERLLPGAELILETCLPPCACPGQIIRTPLVGRFEMIRIDPTPFFDTYLVRDICWRGSNAATPAPITGTGAYQIGGDPGLTHRLILDLTMPDSTTLHLDSGFVPAGPPAFPDIDIIAYTDINVCTRTSVHVVSTPTCSADLNADGKVRTEDLVILLGQFGQSPTRCDVGDINDDGAVNTEDLVILLSQFGRLCP